MLKEKLSEPTTYYDVINRISRHLVLPRSRIRIIDPLTHIFTDRQAIELRFRRFRKMAGEGQQSARYGRPYLPRWLADEEEGSFPDAGVHVENQNRVIIAPSAVNAINMLCRLIRKGEYAFSRLRALATLKNVVDRYAEIPARSRLQLDTYHHLPPAEKDAYRLMVKPTFPDSLALGALGSILMQLFPAEYFLQECCGYIPKRGAKEAVRQVMSRLDEGYRIVLRLDIRSFNETVPQEKLLELIVLRAEETGWQREDRDFLQGLMRSFFSRIDEVLGTPGIGIGMGTSLTPLFTNIYLNTLDRYIKGKAIPFSRFGDDLALFFADRASAEQSRRDVSRFVAGKLMQEINESKATVTELQSSAENGAHSASVNGFDFCAYHFEIDENGRAAIRIKDGTIAKIKRRIKLLVRVPKERAKDSATNRASCGAVPTMYLGRVVEKINSLLGFFSALTDNKGRAQSFFLITGWPAAFLNDASSDGMKEQFKALDQYILYRFKRLVRALGGEVPDAGTFRNMMRDMGLRTFMDAWNRHPRRYRY